MHNVDFVYINMQLIRRSILLILLLVDRSMFLFFKALAFSVNGGLIVSQYIFAA